MNEEGGGTRMKMKKILFVALSFLRLLAFGCSQDTRSSSVTNPKKLKFLRRESTNFLNIISHGS